MPEKPRRGRRPKGKGDTRALILEAALRRFAAAGFDQTTSAEIARDAGVDPALLLYYFDSKETLFFDAVRERLYPQMAMAFAGPRSASRLGEQIVDGFLSLWDAEEQGKALAALVRAGVSNDRIGSLFREYIQSEILPQVARRVGSKPQELRVGLAASQLFGLGLARYVLRLGPMAHARREDLVAAIRPTITRYLTGPIGAATPRAEGTRRGGARTQRSGLKPRTRGDTVMGLEGQA